MFSRWFSPNKKDFNDLNEQEILSLAVQAEEEDGSIYATYAARLRETYEGTAKVFDGMAAEENEHRRQLLELYQRRFGDVLIPIRREHVRGFLERKPLWLMAEMPIEQVRQQIWEMERSAHSFYLAAAARAQDVDTRKLLGDLAEQEVAHQHKADKLAETHLDEEVLDEEEHEQRRQFVLTYVQPGLAGLMDGSVSTLAPVFAAAFATGSTWETFLVGTAASVGAGISMGFTEAASDDGKLTGRGSPVKRGLASGVMTTLGGMGHALPYLIADFWTATTVAVIVVLVELWAIAYIQARWMSTPFWRAVLQVVLGGSLVFAAGILIGNA